MDIPLILIMAMIMTESSCNEKAVGDNGASYGPLQIQECVIQDVRRISGDFTITHDMAFDISEAIRICRVYLKHYCRADRVGRTPTFEDAARMWNGGPNGHKKKATSEYWQKVNKHLVALGYNS